MLAIDDIEASVRTAETVKKHFRDLRSTPARATATTPTGLMDVGVRHLMRETFLSSLELARAVLQGLGVPEREAKTATETFRRHDERRLYAHHGLHNDSSACRIWPRPRPRSWRSCSRRTQPATEGAGRGKRALPDASDQPSWPWQCL